MTYPTWQHLNEEQRTLVRTTLTDTALLGNHCWRLLGKHDESSKAAWQASKEPLGGETGGVANASAGSAALSALMAGHRIAIFPSRSSLAVLDLDLKEDDLNAVLARLEDGTLNPALPKPLFVERSSFSGRAHIFWRIKDGQPGAFIECNKVEEDGSIRACGQATAKKYCAVYQPEVLAQAVKDEGEGEGTELEALTSLLRTEVQTDKPRHTIRRLLRENDVMGLKIEDFCTIIECAEEGTRYKTMHAINCYLYGSDLFDDNDIATFEESCRIAGKTNTEIRCSQKDAAKFMESREIDGTAVAMGAIADQMEESWALEEAAKKRAKAQETAHASKEDAIAAQADAYVLDAEAKENAIAAQADASTASAKPTAKAKPTSAPPKKKGKPKGGGKSGQLLSHGQVTPTGRMVLCDNMTAEALGAGMKHVCGSGKLGVRMNVRSMKPEVFFKGAWTPMSDQLEGHLRDRIRSRCVLQHEAKDGTLVERMASFSPQNFRDAFFTLLMDGGEYDPFLEWLKTLKWDGTPRIEGVLHRLFKADDCEGVRYASRQIFVRAVMRALYPGIESDRVVVLRGGQGCGKSSFFEGLVPVDDIDGHVRGSKSFSFKQALTNAWNTGVEASTAVFVVLDEVWGRTHSERAAEKEWITRKNDDCRLPYGKYSQDLPRRFTLVGTANQGDMMPNDPSGSRRWLVVETNVSRGTIDFGLFYDEREQWWAEAYEMVKDASARELVEREFPSQPVQDHFASLSHELVEEGAIGEAVSQLLAADDYEKLVGGLYNGMSLGCWNEKLELTHVRTDRDGDKKGVHLPLKKAESDQLIAALNKHGLHKGRGRIPGKKNPIHAFFFRKEKLSGEMLNEIETALGREL